MSHTLGVDIGTFESKGVIASADGEVVATVGGQRKALPRGGKRRFFCRSMPRFFSPCGFRRIKPLSTGQAFLVSGVFFRFPASADLSIS